MKPRRLQRKRTRGWRQPEGAIYVGRPTKYGNPYPKTDPRCLEKFRRWVMAKAQATLRAQARAELRGKHLLCWCAEGSDCHADIWLEIANND